LKIHEYTIASVDHPDRDEDAVMVFDGNETKAPVFSVIDGMGGQQHTLADGTLITGRDASQKVRETLIEDLQQLPADVDASPGGEAEKKAIAALTRAHQRVLFELNNGDEYPAGHRVGAVATVVIVCENGKRLLTVQVGDTRGYLLTEGELIQLCPDEDNIEHFVRNGLMSEEDGERITTILNSYDGVNEPNTQGTVTIAGSPYDMYIAWRWFLVGNKVLNIPAANIVINAIGVHEVDPIPITSRIEIAPSDKLLLASDGVYKNLAEAEIVSTFTSTAAADPATALGEFAYERSKDKNNRRSTQDDVSAVTVQFEK
jgi:serine/threonine protein phosphatase PrpC